MSERRGPSRRPSDGTRSGRPRPGGAGGSRSGGPRRESAGDRPRRPRGEGGDDRPSRPRRDDDRPRRPRGEDRDDRPRRPRRDDDRPSRPRRDDGEGRSRFPRRDDDRPRRPRGEDRDDRPRRPRRDDDRPSRPRRDDGEGRSRFPRRDDDRPRRPRGEDRDDRPRRPRRDDDRPSRPRRDDGEGRSRFPRRDDDRPRRPRGEDRDDRPRRPRRDDDRPSRPRRDDGEGRSRFPRRDDDRPRRPRGEDRDDRPRRPQTAAERKSAEVKRRTGGRQTSSTSFMPPSHDRDEKWIDEGPSRPRRRNESDAPQTKSSRSRGAQALPEAVIEFERALGARQAGKFIRRYEAALESFEAHRYGEARTVLSALARECGDVGAVHELLGLCLYRDGSWQKAIVELEAAQKFRRGTVFNHAVLADCYRAIGNFNRVTELWNEMKEASPHQELLAEGRIVYAGSLSDQGKFLEALAIMEKVPLRPRKVLEYHLRQWYVLADLHDRLGNPVKARNIFETILQIDSKFADVAERLSTLGA